ncbi:MAG: hypothetical protein AAF196_09525 [Planctomycetota bacterium]
MSRPPKAHPSILTTLRTSLLAVSLAIVPALGGCDEDRPEPAPDPDPRAQRQPEQTALFHDFGVLAHGEIKGTEFEIPVPKDGPWTPLSFNTGCPCAKQQWLLVKPDGSELWGQDERGRRAQLVPQEGDRLILRLLVDTNEKPPVDLEPQTVAGQVIFQRANTTEIDRRTVPLRFRYGIDAPFTVRPLAALDFGDLSISQTYSETFVINKEGREVTFGRPVAKSLVAGELTETEEFRMQIEDFEDRAELLFEFHPASTRDLGPFQFLIEVPTNYDDYVLRLTCEGLLRPDVYSRPPHRFAFGRIPFGTTKSQRVVVEDYDPSRTPGFRSLGIIDRDGEDLSEHFEVRIQPLSDRPRTSTVDVIYDGLLEKHSFRAELRLANIEGDRTILALPVQGFPLPKPSEDR